MQFNFDVIVAGYQNSATKSGMVEALKAAKASLRHHEVAARAAAGVSVYAGSFHGMDLAERDPSQERRASAAAAHKATAAFLSVDKIARAMGLGPVVLDRPEEDLPFSMAYAAIEALDDEFVEKVGKSISEMHFAV